MHTTPLGDPRTAPAGAPVSEQANAAATAHVGRKRSTWFSAVVQTARLAGRAMQATPASPSRRHTFNSSPQRPASASTDSQPSAKASALCRSASSDSVTLAAFATSPMPSAPTLVSDGAAPFDTGNTLDVQTESRASWPSRPDVSPSLLLSSSSSSSTLTLTATAGGGGGGGCTLADLPTELVCKIAMHAGFFGALALRRTCSRFNAILSQPLAWTDYATLSPDALVNHVTVSTRLHTFDHLIFGQWASPSPSVSLSPSAGSGDMVTKINGQALRKTALAPTVAAGLHHVHGADDDGADPDIFFIHKTFLEQYDFLGGISFHMAPGGLVSAKFFEHRERLDCYADDMAARVQDGTLPPSIDAHVAGGAPTGDARHPHTCGRCAHYDTQIVHRSVFVFDQPPSGGWTHGPGAGVRQSYTYADGRRTIDITVKPFAGGVRQDDLPFVSMNRVSVDGVLLPPPLHSLFLALVHRK
ncbi:hypothetical protein BC831DRAFT_515964 [Entophlyctis helioformis]|nr:hypothetical protein BC831DRAFT_515964 [Entophlyctis helioformis]